MTNVPEVETKRNKALIADYKKKSGKQFVFSTAQLVGKYGISTARIYEILAKYKIPSRGNK